jgi:hypothetical protein
MVEGEPLDSQLFHGYIHGRMAVQKQSTRGMERQARILRKE